MKKSHLLYIVIVIAIVAAVAIGFANKKTVKFADAPATSGITSTVGMNGLYTNNTYHFSAKLPEGYTAREVSGTILFENKSGDGIQVLITPYDDVHALSVEMIKKDIPDLKVEEILPIEVGQNYRGVAFKSDNPAFGGASREVWFVFRSNLYQISTYARLDETLKSVFFTWKFY